MMNDTLTKKKGHWFVVVVVIIAVIVLFAVWWYMEKQAGLSVREVLLEMSQPLSDGVDAEENQIDRMLKGVDVGDLDAEFESIDQDLNSL